MQGNAPDDATLAVIYQLAVLDGRPRAEVARVVRLSRQTVSGYVNKDRQRALDAHARLNAAGQLPDALRRFGVVPPGAQSASVPPPEQFAFDPDLAATAVTPDLIREAASMVAQGLPPEDVLVSLGVDRRDAVDWLDMAEQAYDARAGGWPASGWRLIDRALTHIGLQLRRQALQEPAAAARIIALGRLVAPSMFTEPQSTGAAQSDPFAELSDVEVAALAYGRDPAEAES